MNCILISGLWPTKDNNGLTNLALQIASAMPGVECQVFKYDDKVIPPADILIGHSFGANRAFEIADKIDDRYVSYMGLIDPVANWMPALWNSWKKYFIPKSVLRCESFRRYLPLIPPSGSIENEHPLYKNYNNISMSHADAPRCPYVVNTILKAMRELR